MALQGDYVQSALRSDVPINPSQCQTVKSLRYALEKVQGPPGTGKSTTIFHMVTARLPLHARVLVTCSRNVAVESIAQKLIGAAGEGGLLVFGNASRIGETARSLLLEPRCERHPRVQRLLSFAATAKRLSAALDVGVRVRSLLQCM